MRLERNELYIMMLTQGSSWHCFFHMYNCCHVVAWRSLLPEGWADLNHLVLSCCQQPGPLRYPQSGCEGCHPMMLSTVVEDQPHVAHLQKPMKPTSASIIGHLTLIQMRNLEQRAKCFKSVWEEQIHPSDHFSMIDAWCITRLDVLMFPSITNLGPHKYPSSYCHIASGSTWFYTTFTIWGLVVRMCSTCFLH